MATNRRDVELGIAVKTVGAEEIKTLAADVASLAQQGGEAAPEFARLATEIDKIASQVSAVSVFAKLNTELEQLRATQVAAAASAQEVGTEYQKLAQATKDTSAAVLAAQTGQEQAKRAVDQQKLALELLRLETDTAGKKTLEYKDQVKTLTTGLDNLKAAHTEARIETLKANDAASQAKAAQKELTDSYKSTQVELDKSNVALGTRDKALKEAEAALKQAGVATDDLAGAEARMRSSLQASADYAKILQAEVVALARVQGELANNAAFDKLVSDAKNLRDSASYVQFWTTSLNEAEAAGRLFGQDSGLAKKAADARLLRGATDDIQAFTHELTTAERAEASLAGNQLWDKKLADAQKARSAAETVAFWTKALNEAEIAEKELAAQAKIAAEALDNAFARVGVRSAAAIKAEIDQVNAALLKLTNNANVSGAEFDRAFASAQQRIKGLESELQKLPGHMTLAAQGANLLKSSLGQIAAIYGGIELGQQFVTANVQLETLRRTLALVTGSSSEADKQIQFLRATADQTGLSIGNLTQPFVQFQVSLRQAGYDAQVINDIFVGSANAAGRYGLSTEQLSRVMLAFSQMASKGKVSLEEVQQQLGESLPGATKIAATSLGLTTAEFIKLVESGKLLSEDFLPAVGKAFRENFGDEQTAKVDGLGAGINRFKNTLTLLSQELGDTGALGGMRAALSAVAALVVTLGNGINFTFDTAITGTRQMIALASGDIARVQKLGDDFIARQAVVGAKAQALVIGLAQDTVKSLDSIGQTQSAVVAATETATASLEKGTVAQRALAETTVAGQTQATAAIKTGGDAWVELVTHQNAAAVAAANGVTSQTQLGAATAAAGGSAATATVGWARLLVNIASATEESLKNRIAADATADAKKTEGEASVKLAELYGDEARTRKVAAVAALENVSALEKVAAARLHEQTVLVSYRDAILANMEASKLAEGASYKVSEAKEAEVKATNLKIAVLTAETQKSVEATEAARNEATAKQTLAVTTGDNSKQLSQLTTIRDDASRKLDSYLKLERQGLDLGPLLANSRRDLALAETAVRDAVNDTIDAMTRRSAQQREQLGLSQQGIDIERVKLETDLKIAAMSGQYSDQLGAQIKLKELDIKATEATIKALGDQAKALLEEARLRDSQLLTTDANYAAKLREIDSIRNSGVALQNTSKIEQERLRVLNYELGITNGTLYDGRVALDNYGKSVDSATGKLEKMAKAASILDKYKYGSETITNPTLTQSPNPAVSSEQDAVTAAAAKLQALSNPSTYQQSANTGYIGLRPYQVPVVDTMAVVEATRALQEAGAALDAKRAAPATSSRPTTQGGYEIRFVLGGTTRTVIADSKSAAESLVKDLEAAFKSAGG